MDDPFDDFTGHTGALGGQRRSAVADRGSRTDAARAPGSPAGDPVTGRGPRPTFSSGALREGPSRWLGEAMSTRDTLRLAGSLLYVRRLDRSLAFYEEVFELRVHTRQPNLALLESADGAPVLALRAIGENAARGLEQVGISRLVWFAPAAPVARLRERLRLTGTRELLLEDGDGDGDAVVFADPDGIVHVVIISETPGEWPGHGAIPRAAWLRGA